jgi:hypothetical protein
LTQPIKNTTGVQQGCPVSQALFNTHTHAHTHTHTHTPDYYRMERGGDERNQNLKREKRTKTLMFGDDQVIVADSEDALQVSVH